MYRYTEHDRGFLKSRVAEFRDQTERWQAGEIDEDEYKQLRLRNGLYVQRHAPMLRVAIPYGQLSSDQMRALAHVARTWDKGYGHITTRQNIQYNWPEIPDVPDILDYLADVDMHAIQTSGNCIRNTTSDPLAGAAEDEVEDPRPWCELIRQWSTLHPEFNWLPRKFKIAVTGAESDRAAVQIHDIGLRLIKRGSESGFEVLVGGGLGRTPHIGSVIRDYLPGKHLLSYLSAILRVYNLEGRRDNLYKARIKILVATMGIDQFREKVEAEWQASSDTVSEVQASTIDALRAMFPPPPPVPGPALDASDLDARLESDPIFGQWYRVNTRGHRDTGRRIVYLPLKNDERPAGDLTDTMMDVIADLADRYALGELRTTHDQNLVFAHVARADLVALWRELRTLGLATPNLGHLTDMIVCPGLDFCSLANAGTLTLYDQVQARFDDIDYLHDIGEISVKVSGCMNACGHHHIGDIGILGVEKHGKEWYQLTLGGHAGNAASLGKRLGKALPQHEVIPAIDTVLNVYLSTRLHGESFAQTVRRVGVTPFQEVVYAVKVA